MEAVRAQVEELSPEQKARVEEVKNSIDLMDSQAALQYGVGGAAEYFQLFRQYPHTGAQQGTAAMWGS